MTVIDVDQVSLRTETDADKDFLLRLFISTREAEMLKNGWLPNEIALYLTSQFETQYQAYRQSYPDAEYKVLEFEQQSIGRLYLDRGDKDYRLIDIALLPEFRNQGLGQHLIRILQQSATIAGKPITLHVEHNNPAFRLYQRLGFQMVEDRGMHLFMRWNP